MVRCKQCGIALSPEFGNIPRLPCPECESIGRDFSMAVGNGRINVSGGIASLIHTRPGLQSTAQVDDQGKITLTSTGPSPKNEEGSLEISARLVRMLNWKGGTWSVPVEGQKDVDWYSENSTGDALQIQVVRASNNQELWQKLSETGSASISYVASIVADEIIAAIAKKSRKYPREQKKELFLVLDAARTPSHTFQQVLDAFRKQHLQECQNAGFAQVWIVGPQDSLVERLDL